MADTHIALMAHLMRRAGFGAPYDELERRLTKGYEATVEELLDLENTPDFEDDLVLRYRHDWSTHAQNEGARTYWAYRMIRSPRPLQEKMA